MSHLSALSNFELRFLAHGAAVAAPAVVDGYDEEKHEYHKADDAGDDVGGVFLVLAQLVGDGRVVAHNAVDGLQGEQNGGIPMLVLQFGHHHAVLNAAAKGVGQCAFEAVAREYLVTAVLSGEQDNQSRALLLAAYAVTLA